jgi:hypothetical protein
MRESKRSIKFFEVLPHIIKVCREYIECAGDEESFENLYKRNEVFLCRVAECIADNEFVIHEGEFRESSQATYAETVAIFAACFEARINADIVGHNS